MTYTDPKIGVTSKGRANTKVRDLVHKYNLGDSVAGNFFLSQWDSHVPEVYKKGHKSDVKNCRPKSLFPIVLKILERCIFKILYPILHNKIH